MSKGALNEALINFLATPDLLAHGFTFRDIKLGLAEPQLRLRLLGGGGVQDMLLGADLVMASTGIELTSTQPLLGGYADPRCSAQADIGLHFVLVVGSDPNALLSVRPPDLGQPSLTVSNLSFDSQNLTCDALIAFVDLPGFADALRRAVEHYPGLDAAGRAVIAQTQTAVAAIDAEIGPLVPSDLQRLNAWFTYPAGFSGPGLITVLFGAPTPVPDPGPRASIAGAVRLGGAFATRGWGADLPISCSALPVNFSRKLGPAPVPNSDGALGSPPLQQIRTTSSCIYESGKHSSQIAGLSPVLPNYFETPVAGGCQTVNDPGRYGAVVMFSGFGSNRIRSGELSNQFDLVVQPFQRAPCAPQ